MHIRTYRISTGGDFNMLFCNITKKEDSCKEFADSLTVQIHLSDEMLNGYMNMQSDKERYNFYLALLERGYKIASHDRAFPTDILLNLHTQLKLNNYKCEWLFKKKTIKEYGIKVVLDHVLTSCNYKLRLSLFDTKNQFITEGCIYQTYPDDIFFNKDVRHLVVEDGKLIITDFLDHPQFVCELSDLSNGIVKSVCVDANTRKYIPNEENREKFERLKW